MAKGKIYVKSSVDSSQWIQINIETSMDNIENLSQTLETFIKKSDLLDNNNKVKKQFIPDSILAGLTYGGTVEFQEGGLGQPVVTLSSAAKYLLNLEDTTTNSIQLNNDYYDYENDKFIPSSPTQTISVDVIDSNGNVTTENRTITHEGLFYIVSENGFTLNAKDFNVGDWLLAVDNAWNKVDNTDEITSINNRTGDIYTYMGRWEDVISQEVTYYRGDIISYNNNLYIATCDRDKSIIKAVNSEKTPDTDSTNWSIFGIDWSGRIDKLEGQLESTSNQIKDLPKFIHTKTTENNPNINNYTTGSIWIQIEA